MKFYEKHPKSCSTSVSLAAIHFLTKTGCEHVLPRSWFPRGRPATCAVPGAASLAAARENGIGLALPGCLTSHASVDMMLSPRSRTPWYSSTLPELACPQLPLHSSPLGRQEPVGAALPAVVSSLSTAVLSLASSDY